MQPNVDPHLPEEQPKPRRRRRRSHGSLEEGEGEGWAVSYSDMLMVILSFFIIFYNSDESTGKGEGEGAVESLVHFLRLDGSSTEIDPKTGEKVEVQVEAKKPKQIIPGFPEGTGKEEPKLDKVARNIATFFGGKKKKPQQMGKGNDVVAGVQEGQIENIQGITFSEIKPKQIAGEEGKWNQILNKTNDEVTYKGGIMIDFADNLYNLGKYDLDPKAMNQINRVLKMIKPYENRLNIVFIGHSDSIPVKASRRVINSNMLLSSMRAAKAVEYAIGKGFDPFWVSSQGLSQNVRNTRSLSMRIMER